jgi:hypothetical protein
LYRRIFVLILLVLSQVLPAAAQNQSNDAEGKLQFEFEAGPVWQTRNDVQIPNTPEGTRFSILDLVGKGPFAAARLYVTWNVSDRHALRMLLAPLQIRESSNLDSQVRFEGGVFEPGILTEATYKFNSWRLTYRYRMRDGERFSWWLGFTGKIRDAKIGIKQPDESAAKTDIGFVPLLHVAARIMLNESWSFDVDADALAGGPGRAEDLSVKLTYRTTDRIRLSFGYRTVEGGADVEEVYNFAWLHYLALGGAILF